MRPRISSTAQTLVLQDEHVPATFGRSFAASSIRSTGSAISWSDPFRLEIDWNATASGSTINIGSASGGKLEMLMRSKPGTTAKRRTTGRAHSGRRDPLVRRLPRHRPPTHPGEMLFEEFVKPHGITQSKLAHSLGISFPRLNEIIRGKRAVTPDTALRLARVVGMSAEFWLGLQADWDLWHAMRSSKAAEISQLAPLRPSNVTTL